MNALMLMSRNSRETVLGNQSAKEECFTLGKRKFSEVFGDKGKTVGGLKNRIKGTQLSDQFDQLKNVYGDGKRPKFI